jgi:hypothetical protein
MENQPLLTDEPVEFEKKNWLEFKTSGKLRINLEGIIEYASK